MGARREANPLAATLFAGSDCMRSSEACLNDPSPSARHASRTAAYNSLSTDDNATIDCVVFPASGGCNSPTSHRWATQQSTASAGVNNTTTIRRCQLAPPRPSFQALHGVDCIEKWLCHRSAGLFAGELDVWSIQSNEQVSQTLDIECSCLICHWASNWQWVLRQECGFCTTGALLRAGFRIPSATSPPGAGHLRN